MSGLDSAELDHKRRKVAAAEASWLHDLEAKTAAALQRAMQRGATAAAAEAAAPQQQGAEGGRGGWGLGGMGVSLHSLINSILGNLQLVLTNVHVRYEDDGWAWGGHRLAVGVLLGRVAANTVDEQGKPAFVTANVLLLLRKVRQGLRLGGQIGNAGWRWAA